MKQGVSYIQLKINMTTREIQIKEKNDILKGLEKVYEKLLEFKKSKNSELVVLRNNKIVKIVKIKAK